MESQNSALNGSNNDQKMIEYRPNYLVFQNEYAHLVNSLSYIDAKIDEKDKVLVNEAIKQEMQRMPADRDYLDKFPLPKLNYLVCRFIPCIKVFTLYRKMS